jgi:hypothetical protein
MIRMSHTLGHLNLAPSCIKAPDDFADAFLKAQQNIDTPNSVPFSWPFRLHSKPEQ